MLFRLIICAGHDRTYIHFITAKYTRSPFCFQESFIHPLSIRFCYPFAILLRPQPLLFILGSVGQNS